MATPPAAGRPPREVPALAEALMAEDGLVLAG